MNKPRPAFILSNRIDRYYYFVFFIFKSPKGRSYHILNVVNVVFLNRFLCTFGFLTATQGFLSVTLGDLFDFVFLSNGVTVGGTLGGVHELISHALTHGFHGSETGFTGSGDEEVDSEVNSSHGGDIDSLLSDNTGSTDSGGIFSGAGVNDSLDNDLKGVSTSHEVDDLKSVSNDSDGKGLLTSVSTVEHKSVDESFHDWALGLSELFDLPSTSGVGNVDLTLSGADSDVVLESKIFNLYFGVIPSTEKLGTSGSFLGLCDFLNGFSDFSHFVGSLKRLSLFLLLFY